MRDRKINSEIKKPNRKQELPETQLGFPERNDVINPNADMERVHVDLPTMDLSRKSSGEVDREIQRESGPAAERNEASANNE
ncbi:MAG: hypothetical protein ACOYXT_25470 [Bacteroidota bacterium]